MFRCSDNGCTGCIRRQRSFESRPLVSSVTLNPLHSRGACCTVGLCVTSKAAILVLLWNVFIGGLCSVGRDYIFVFLISIFYSLKIDVSFSVVALYSLTAVVYLFYPCQIH